MTARAVGLNPVIYVRDAMHRIARCSDVTMLTPHGWKELFAEEVAARHDDVANRLVIRET